MADQRISYTDAFGHRRELPDREEAAATGAVLTEAELADTRYPNVGKFKVIWVDERNGRVYEYDVEAGSMADAAWQVARYMFNSVSPDGRRLMDVVRLS